jgi:N-acyl-D-aspartate/D-glutamate deacylase
MSIEGRVHPLLAAPSYQAIAHLPFAERVGRLGDPELRRTIISEMWAAPTTMGPMNNWSNCFVIGQPANYAVRETDSIQAVAEQRGVTPAEVAYDALMEFNGEGCIYVPVANFTDRNMDITREMLVHPLTIPGLGDGGAHCTIISDASFATFLLTHWARDAAPSDRMPIEFVIQRQCADTARMVGLLDRGVVAPGYKADVNVIDFDNLALPIPEYVHDFPNGAGRYVQRASGYDCTLVNGQVFMEGGEHTGSLAGRTVRSTD